MTYGAAAHSAKDCALTCAGADRARWGSTNWAWPMTTGRGS